MVSSNIWYLAAPETSSCLSYKAFFTMITKMNLINGEVSENTQTPERIEFALTCSAHLCSKRTF